MSHPNSSSQTVAAVVVTYNRKALLAECLNGLLSQSRPADAIYVVDNASSDGTGDLIANRYASAVKYERLPENVGGAGGFHQGMKRAYADGYEYIWVMDDDVRPETACLQELLCSPMKASVLVPLRISNTGELAEYAATKGSWDTATVRGFKSDCVNEVFHEISAVPAIINLEDLSFEGPLFHRSIITKVGLPRADFFLFADDTEYAWRILRAGYGPCICVTAARMVRMLSMEGNSSLWRDYYIRRNRLYVKRLYTRGTWTRAAADVVFLLSSVKRVIIGREKWQDLRIRLQAWVDSFRDPLPRRYLPRDPQNSATGER